MAVPERRHLITALGLAPLAALGLLAGCDRLPGAAASRFDAIDITGADYAQALELPDGDGRLRSLAEFKGKLVVLFFGYVQCPDVCPTTLQEIAETRRALGADGERVQGVFVTVDPERDTPEIVKAYVEAFDAGIVGLRGTPEQTREIARRFKVFYNKVPGSAPGSYSVDHTAGRYVYDTKGRVRLFTRQNGGSAALVKDLRRLLEEG